MKYHSKRGTKTWYPRYNKKAKRTQYSSFRKGLRKFSQKHYSKL